MKRALYVLLGSILVLGLSLLLFIGLGDFRSPGASPSQPAETPAPPPTTEQSEAATNELPAFPYPELLADQPNESSQALVVLGRGSHGNLWVTEKNAGRYNVLAGPFYCRLGKEGLTGQKVDNDGKTPLGTYQIGTLYGVSKPRGSALVFQELDSGDVWVTDAYSVYYNQLYQASSGDQDFTEYRALARNKNSLYLDIGYNAARVPGAGAFVMLANSGNTSVPTEGEIHLATADMLRTVQALDAEKKPVFTIHQMEETAWQLEQSMAPGFVFLEQKSSLTPNPVYAANTNWAGQTLPGYFGKHVALSDMLSENLAEAQRALRGKRLGLMVFDGYRPNRAGQWLYTHLTGQTQPDKEAATVQSDAPAVSLYQANQMHSYGLALDLTLISLADGSQLDMGGNYDFRSASAAFAASGLTEEQRNNRQILRDAMLEAGFTASDEAWWHFELLGALQIQSAYDFLIPQ